jgi:hypothetical protein
MLRPIPLAISIHCSCSLCKALKLYNLIWPDPAPIYPEH